MTDLGNATFRITRKGEARLESDAWGDSPTTKILTALVQGSGGNESIAEETGLSKKRVERLMPPLVRAKFVSAHNK